MESTKEKLDKALGISCGKSLDEMLDDLNIDAVKTETALDSLDEAFSAEIQKIDEKSAELQKQDISKNALAISDMTESLKQIEIILHDAYDMFQHVKDSVVSTDLVDAELIQGAAKLLEALHVNINEFVSIYKSKTKFLEKIKLMALQQQYKIEAMELKHKHDLELLEAKNKASSEADVVDAGELVTYNTDDVTKMLQRMEEKAYEDRIRNSEIGVKIDPLKDDDIEYDDDDNDEDKTRKK